MSDSSQEIDCPPKRENYRNANGSFDGKKFMEDIQKCNKKKADQQGSVDSGEVKGCNNILNKGQDSKTDKLIRFNKTSSSSDKITYCMYYSEFKKTIQEICNIYTQWNCISEPCNIDEKKEGHGYAPILHAYDLLSILKFTNHNCIIKDAFWKINIYASCYLTMETIIQIQQLVDSNDENEVNIEIQDDIKDGDNFRIGNLYGTKGIGQTHGQWNKTFLFCKLTEPPNITNVVPKDDLFQFSKMEKSLALQLEIKELINKLYAEPMDLRNESLNNFFLTTERFNDTDICPDTFTVIMYFFMYYNNEILLPDLGFEKNDSERSITQVDTLQTMRDKINKNHEELNKSFSYENIHNLMNTSRSPSRSNPSTPSRTPVAGLNFSQSPGSPRSPFTPNNLDMSIRSNIYDFGLSPEHTNLNRTPLSPIMPRLTIDDLNVSPVSGSDFGTGLGSDSNPAIQNLGSLFGPDSDSNPTTPLRTPSGGKRKKTIRKNKKKKTKRTRKRSKK